MHHRVIKICFVFLLMVILITSSPSFANIDSHLKNLDLDSTKTVLRALNSKFKVDWLSVKSNHPNRRVETQKILNFLTFILDERLKKIMSLSAQLREKFCDPDSRTFYKFNELFNGWYLRKEGKCNDTKKAQLMGECENSHSGDLYTFEWLGPFPNKIEDPSVENFVMLQDGEELSRIPEPANPLIAGFVMVGPSGEEDLDSVEVYFQPKPQNWLFPPEFQAELGMASTPLITSPKPVIRSSKPRMPLRLSKGLLNSEHRASKSVDSSLPKVGSSSISVKRPSELSKKSLKSSRKPSTPVGSSLPELGNSSTSVRRPSELSKKSLKSSRKPSTPVGGSLPEVGNSSMSVRKPSELSKKSLKPHHKPSKSVVSTSTSSNTGEDSERLQLQQDMKDRETLLSKLDEKGAKVALHAILNNYLIPLEKFDLNDENDKDRYQHVHDYLSWILQNKIAKASNKKETISNADAERAEFANYWYEKKCFDYQNRLEIIWELFRQVHQPQTN